MFKNVETPPNNGAVFTILQTIKAVMSLAAEAKIGALYINCREAVPARHVLEFMGHKQPPTPMQTDNTTALGVVNKNVMKKIKVDGHEIPLAKVPHQSDAIQTLLGSRVNKLGQLLYKASPRDPQSNKNKTQVPYRYFNTNGITE